MFPPNSSRLELAATTASPIRWRSRSPGGVAPLTVLVNGVPRRPSASRRTLFFEPDGPGFVAANGDGRQGRVR